MNNNLFQYFNARDLFNWFAEYINRHLSSLHRFKYHFRIYLAEELIKNDSENILKR
jgi:hypothetical protein